jgi:hypothetical protein
LIVATALGLRTSWLMVGIPLSYKTAEIVPRQRS